MTHDVGDRLAAHGEDYPLTGSDRVDDLTRPVAKLAHPICMCDTVDIAQFSRARVRMGCPRI